METVSLTTRVHSALVSGDVDEIENLVIEELTNAPYNHTLNQTIIYIMNEMSYCKKATWPGRLHFVDTISNSLVKHESVLAVIDPVKYDKKSILHARSSIYARLSRICLETLRYTRK